MSVPKCRKCGESRWSDEGRCLICKQFPTLGYQVGEFIEAHAAIPDRDQVGEPYILTDEMWRFLLNFYRINPHVVKNEHGNWKLPFKYTRGAQLTRSQKWGKGPFAGAMMAGEAVGPARFDGWDANGQPVGKAWSTPIIQIAASSEDQTDNTWMALIPMITLGDFGAEIPETGMSRIYLPNGGWIEPVASSARSRLGQRIVFLVQDQTESWTQENGGRSLADVQRRNIAGMGGRWLSTNNAWDPGENSVAQWTSEEEAKDGSVYLDDIEPPDSFSVRNKSERRKALKIVYGDSWWVDLDRVDAEIVSLLRRDPAQAERWYLNRKRSAESAAWNSEILKDATDPDFEEPPKTRIVIGVDGARYADALAVIATDVVDGRQWPIGIWERPEGADEDYEHPLEDVYQAVDEAWKSYRVWRMYVDPQYIEGLCEKWQGQYGHKKVLEWRTNRPRMISAAVRTYTESISSGEITLSPDDVFQKHLRNATKQKVNVYDENHVQLHTIAKERPDSPRKMDGAMAAVLSWEARGDCVAAGKARRAGKSRGFS